MGVNKVQCILDEVPRVYYYYHFIYLVFLIRTVHKGHSRHLTSGKRGQVGPAARNW